MDAAELDALERVSFVAVWRGMVKLRDIRIGFWFRFWVRSEQLAFEREVAAELGLRAGASALHVLTHCQGVFESLLGGVCAEQVLLCSRRWGVLRSRWCGPRTGRSGAH